MSAKDKEDKKGGKEKEKERAAEKTAVPPTGTKDGSSEGEPSDTPSRYRGGVKRTTQRLLERIGMREQTELGDDFKQRCRLIDRHLEVIESLLDGVEAVMQQDTGKREKGLLVTQETPYDYIAHGLRRARDESMAASDVPAGAVADKLHAFLAAAIKACDRLGQEHRNFQTGCRHAATSLYRYQMIYVEQVKSERHELIRRRLDMDAVKQEVKRAKSMTALNARSADYEHKIKAFEQQADLLLKLMDELTAKKERNGRALKHFLVVQRDWHATAADILTKAIAECDKHKEDKEKKADKDK